MTGDRIIDNSSNVGSYRSFYGAGKETTQFWRQLYLAGYLDQEIKDPGNGNCWQSDYSFKELHPQAKLGGDNYWIVWSRQKKTYYGLRSVTGCTYNPATNMTPAQVKYIDVKLDDGMPHTGKVIHNRRGSGNYVHITGHSAGCTTGSSAASDYDLSADTINETNCSGLQIDFY